MQLRICLVARISIRIARVRRRDEKVSDEFQKHKIHVVLVVSVIPHIDTQQRQQHDREGETPTGEDLAIGRSE